MCSLTEQNNYCLLHVFLCLERCNVLEVTMLNFEWKRPDLRQVAGLICAAYPQPGVYSCLQKGYQKDAATTLEGIVGSFQVTDPWPQDFREICENINVRKRPRHSYFINLFCWQDWLLIMNLMKNKKKNKLTLVNDDYSIVLFILFSLAC